MNERSWKISQIRQYIKPHWAILLVSTSTALALLIRWSVLGFVTPDFTNFLKPWYETIQGYNGLKALAYPFSNYTPPYLYLLALISGIHFLEPLITIKLLSIVFDLMAAFIIYRILRLKFPKGWTPAAGAVLFGLAPTVFINSALWAQCDVIYTSFLLAFLLFILKDKPWLAMLCFAVAFSFKLQAIFITPFILIQIFRRKVPWHSLFLVPAVYMILVIPAWLQGRSLTDLLQIYLWQMSDNIPINLSFNAPNPYIFLNGNTMPIVTLIGIDIAGIVALGFALAAWKMSGEITMERLVFEATLVLFLIPFLLPKMHERYFYPAAAFMLVLVGFRPGFWWIAILFQVTSYLSYLPYLFLWDNQTVTVKIGAVGNAVILVVMLLDYVRRQVVMPVTIPDKAI